MNSNKEIQVTVPLPSESPGWSDPLFAASVRWQQRNGHWPTSFVSDVTTATADPRADGMIATLLRCGFATHRHIGVDTVDDMVGGIRACGARLVLICARGESDPEQVRAFILAIPDVDFILVAGDPPSSATVREGDPGSRGYYVDPIGGDGHVAHVMQFVSCSLGIAAR